MSRIEKIKAMLARRPEDVELHYMLAMEHRAAGDYEAAVAAFDDCIRLQPQYAPAYFQKANALLTSERVPEARAALQLGIAQARAAGDEHAAQEMAQLLESL
jgi:tetratricopeptide (TPR) repeat protein